jgi:uncharacterized protein
MDDDKEVLMKRLVLVLIMVALMSPPVYADDLQEGIDAGIRGDYKTALEKLMPLAEKGDAEAQRNIGFMYYQGHGVTRSYDEALHWYLKSADQGSAKAQISLGSMYAQGHGTPKNNKEAVKWFRAAAEKKEPMAQTKLGMMYFDGIGVVQNFKEAAKWFLLAAEQSDPAAQLFLGRLSLEGKGVTKNYVQALKWSTIAEANGNKLAPKIKDLLLKNLSPEHISKAQLLADEWISAHKRVVDDETFKKYGATVGMFPIEFLELSQDEKEAYVRGVMDGEYIFTSQNKSRELKIFVTCLNSNMNNIISTALKFKESDLELGQLMPWSLSTLVGQACDKNPKDNNLEYNSGTTGFDLMKIWQRVKSEEEEKEISKAYVRGAIDGGVFYLYGHFYPKINEYLACLSKPGGLKKIINLFDFIPVSGGELGMKNIQALLVLDAERYVCKEIF